MVYTYRLNMTETNQAGTAEETIEISSIDIHAPYGADDNERVDAIDEIPGDADYVRIWYSTGYSAEYTQTDDGRTQIDYYDNDDYNPQIHDTAESIEDTVSSVVAVDVQFVFDELDTVNPDGAALRTVGLTEQ